LFFSSREERNETYSIFPFKEKSLTFTLFFLIFTGEKEKNGAKNRTLTNFKKNKTIPFFTGVDEFFKEDRFVFSKERLDKIS
jgi:hypothetical protein